MRSLAQFEVVLIKDSWTNTGDTNSDSWMPMGEEQERRSLLKVGEDKNKTGLVEQRL